jgi:hypothetical protein
MDDMSPAPGPGELGAFLKARRSRLSPRDLGLQETGIRRKVAGLRREEVAQLAAISVDYYTRLEQGRVQASASALATVARALRLDDDQQAYLYEIAGKTGDGGAPPSASGPPCGGCSTSSPRPRRSSWAGGWTSSRGTPWPRPSTPTSGSSPPPAATTCACCSPTPSSAA